MESDIGNLPSLLADDVIFAPLGYLFCYANA